MERTEGPFEVFHMSMGSLSRGVFRHVCPRGIIADCVFNRLFMRSFLVEVYRDVCPRRMVADKLTCTGCPWGLCPGGCLEMSVQWV